MKTKNKIQHLILAGLFGTATAQAEVLYQSDFTGTTLSSAGLVKSSGAAGGSWGINIAGDFLDGLGSGNARSNVTTIDSFALADGYKGFQLDTTFRTTGGMTRYSFGLVDANYTISRSNDWLNSSLAGAYGIGFSTNGSDYLGFNNGAGTVTGLSTAQSDATVGTAWQSMSMIVTDESWSYSLNNATATTGSHTFETSRSYDFTAHAQRNANADFQNISVTAIRPEWEGGTGNWDTGFTHGASETHTIAFSGAGGTATNNIADTTLTNVHDIEFMSGAGAYTLEANAATAGASGGTALIVNGSIINNSANAQTINTALDFAATRTVEANTADITIGGLISGAGGLTKEGASTLQIHVQSNYTGLTTVNGGTLVIDNSTGTARSFKAGNIDINNGATLQTTSTGGGQTRLQNQTITFDANGGGTINISDQSTRVGGSAFVTTGGSTNFITGNLLDLGNQITFNVADGTDDADLQLNNGINRSGINKLGAGTLRLTNTFNNLQTNVLDINAGVVELGGAGQLVNGNYSGNITNDGIFRHNSTNNQILNGVISGTGAIEKDNNSTLTLTGNNNTYSGNTTVSDGTLIIDGNQSGATGAMTINVSGTLGGSGTIGASLLTVNGVIAPGNSPGTLTTGAQLWNDGGSYLWEINDSATWPDGAGKGQDPGWDWLDITGALDLTNLTTGGFTIDIDSLTSGNIAGDAVGFDTWTKGAPGDFDYSFTIATFDSLIGTFDASLFTLDSSGFTNGPSWDWQIKLSGNDLVLEAYAVPEPSSAALLGLGGLALMLRRKRS
jgi:autotransporter-associated beta strand protein